MPAPHSVLKALLALSLLLPAMALADKNQELETLIKKLEAARSDASSMEKEEKALAEETDKIRASSIVLAAKIQASESKVTRKQSSLAALGRQINEREAKLNQRRGDVARLIHGILRIQRIPSEASFFGGENQTQLLQSASALRVTTHAAGYDMKNLAEEITELSSLRDEFSQEEAALLKEQTALKSDQMDMQRMMQEKIKASAALSRDKQAANRRVNQLVQQSASLKDLMQRLEQDAELFKHIGSPKGKPLPPSASPASRQFPLPLPAQGKVVHHYGEQKSAKEKYSGIVIETAPSAQVTAPYGGEIVFSGPFMDYGKMIILRCDMQHHLLVSGLSDSYISIGDSVKAGEPLGVMGEALGKRNLYVELRKHSKAVDPSSWIRSLGMATASR